MHQSSSFTSWGLDRNWKTGMQLVQVFCICTQSHHKVKLTAVFWRGVGSTQCLYNNGRLSLPSTPICNHIERSWLPSILHKRISMVLHLQHHISRTKHTKSFIKFLQLCPFFSILFHFFPSFFFFSEKRGDCDDDAADW